MHEMGTHGHWEGGGTCMMGIWVAWIYGIGFICKGATWNDGHMTNLYAWVQ